MNDEELLELESLLESPEFIDELTEDHFHQLAGVYHRGQMAKITKKILEDLNAQHDLSEKAIKSHKDYPLYRHHADEAVRHHNACSEEVNLEESAQTNNEGRGFHGELVTHFGLNNADNMYSQTHSKIKNLLSQSGHLSDVKNPNIAVRDYLDSQHGRHLYGKHNDHEYVKKDFAKFKRSYDPTLFVNEEIVEMPDSKERFTKMMSPKLDDVLRSASKALAGKLLSPEEQLRGTFND